MERFFFEELFVGIGSLESMTLSVYLPRNGKLFSTFNILMYAYRYFKCSTGIIGESVKSFHY